MNIDLLYIKMVLFYYGLFNSIFFVLKKLTLRASKLAEEKFVFKKYFSLLLDLTHVRLIFILLFPMKLYF